MMLKSGQEIVRMSVSTSSYADEYHVVPVDWRIGVEIISITGNYYRCSL